MPPKRTSFSYDGRDHLFEDEITFFCGLSVSS
jgi:hypothetical protein